MENTFNPVNLWLLIFSGTFMIGSVVGVFAFLRSSAENKKNNLLIILWYIFLALPIPVSLLSLPSTIMAITTDNIFDGTYSWFEILGMMVAMLLAGTYLISYTVSLRITLTKKRNFLSKIMLLPIFHILLFTIFTIIMLWWLD